MQLLIVCLTGSGTALGQDAGQPATAVIDGTRAAIIIFLPPSARDAQDSEATEARASAALAIELTRRCFGRDDVSYKLLSADRMIVRLADREEIFDLWQFPSLPGAVFVRPGANPRIVVAGGGAEALERLVPSAAGDYFGRACPHAAGGNARQG